MGTVPRLAWIHRISERRTSLLHHGLPILNLPRRSPSTTNKLPGGTACYRLDSSRIVSSVAFGLPDPRSNSKNSSRTARQRPTRSITMSTPQFWSTPLRYIRWASHEKPAILYSLLIGSMGPVALVGLPPLRRALGDVDPEPIPLSYPGKHEPVLFSSVRDESNFMITNWLWRLTTIYHVQSRRARV